jgi:hypothetical protein
MPAEVDSVTAEQVSQVPENERAGRKGGHILYNCTKSTLQIGTST